MCEYNFSILTPFLQRILMFSRCFRSVLEGLIIFILMCTQASLILSSLASNNYNNVMLQSLLADSTRCWYSVDKGSLHNTSFLLGYRFSKLSIFQVMHHYAYHGCVLLVCIFKINVVLQGSFFNLNGVQIWSEINCNPSYWAHTLHLLC